MGANAQTSVPAFTSGQVLTAAQMTQVNTGIPVFADSTARDAAFGGAGEKTLAEGQMAYLEDTNTTQYYDGSSWSAIAVGKILQVLSTTKTDTFSSSSTTFTAITGLSQAITPSSATSKVLVIANIKGASDEGTAGCTFNYRLMRDSTPIDIGDAAGSRDQTTGSLSTRSIGTAYILMADTAVILDSPATTSSTTYSVQGRTQSAGTFYLNRTEDDSNSALIPRSISSITVMEVSA